jgi:hypothetical protein
MKPSAWLFNLLIVFEVKVNNGIKLENILIGNKRKRRNFMQGQWDSGDWWMRRAGAWG